jgi:hypothetical protein
MKFHRFNISEINPSKVQWTPQGGIKVVGAVIKEGVFTYGSGFGDNIVAVREYIPLAELIKGLPTLDGAPVTNEHPDEMVGVQNYKETSIGHVSSPRVEGKVIVADITINDQETIDDIVAGRKRELSAGYYTTTVNRKGIWGSDPYDVIQTDIIFNHCSVVEMGRCGPDVALRLNSKNNQIFKENLIQENKMNEEKDKELDLQNSMEDQADDMEDKENMDQDDGHCENCVRLQEMIDELEAKLNEYSDKDEEDDDDQKENEESEDKSDEEDKENESDEEKEEEDDQKLNAIQKEVQDLMQLHLKAKDLGLELSGRENKKELQLLLVQTQKGLDVTGKSQDYIQALVDDILTKEEPWQAKESPKVNGHKTALKALRQPVAEGPVKEEESISDFIDRIRLLKSKGLI